jgi:hypothetical protein
VPRLKNKRAPNRVNFGVKKNKSKTMKERVIEEMV